eukprot:scaffold4910_cov169-Amphora_coffeaeformis.AAC.7
MNPGAPCCWLCRPFCFGTIHSNSTLNPNRYPCDTRIHIDSSVVSLETSWWCAVLVAIVDDVRANWWTASPVRQWVCGLLTSVVASFAGDETHVMWMMRPRWLPPPIKNTAGAAARPTTSPGDVTTSHGAFSPQEFSWSLFGSVIVGVYYETSMKDREG